MKEHTPILSHDKYKNKDRPFIFAVLGNALCVNDLMAMVNQEVD
jgi:hypothetical protein